MGKGTTELTGGDVMANTTTEDALTCKQVGNSQARNTIGNDFLQELHHRIKNNLQIVCSLLRIQGRGLHDSNAQETFRRMEERIHSMALVYDKLSESSGYDSVQLGEYLKEVAVQLVSGVRRSPERPRLTFNLTSVVVSSVVATRLGLLINEIISNHLRHRSVEPGVDLELALEVVSNQVRLSFSEIGEVRSRVESHPGERDRQVLTALVAQIKGEITEAGPGSSGAVVSFPADVLLTPA
jgi:two-component sensor histidine kinase